MTEVVKFIWLLLKEEPVYIALILMITGAGVIFAYFLKNIFRTQKSRIIWMIAAFLMSVMVSVIAVEPEVTYVKIQEKKNEITFILENCKVSAFEAQQAGLFGATKDAWSCPDGITRYLPVKYRPEGSSSVNKEH
ncbi:MULTISPECIES: hypothetical protein [Enterobacteriaceae]|uniref:Uncharacterized protein n=1 Tax=Klebsiella michiganensis TaxID=1134687 RepID=A0AAJ1NSQ9_9ENTR|nr:MULTISPECIES: hypothetical protein [Enterobacteriaceae]MDH0965323.1 hypothetical protein [Klebsiella michiganensis]MDI3170865.1 hypothetical protein [Klebsiella michiganensis]MDS7914565.1 hypothetical protein [Klebsiella pasteurii]UDV50492.1 hypothetical protein LJU40_28725 [Klebsiella michiganensis]UHC90689.1 hypothetical protein LUW95_28750 [Klebsiella michiganensis]